MAKSINIITNTNSRLEPLKTLFLWMVSKNLGHYSNGCFITDSSLTVRPKTKEEQTFQVIQEYSKRMGHSFVCYYISL
jgi:murein endopeptidase